MRMTESGVFRSWETLATKSAFSCAISVSRRVSRHVSTTPATMTATSTPKAPVKSMTWRRTTSRGEAPGGA